MTPIELPRGCSQIQYGGIEAYTKRLFLPSAANPTEWTNDWQPRERQIIGVYKAIARNFLLRENYDPQATAYLAQRDEETGLPLRVLLAQGVNSLGKDRFVLTTTNRVARDATNKEAILALGGKIQFGVFRDLRWERRQAQGKIIGVTLNTGLKAAKLTEGQEATVTMTQLDSLIHAIIAARKSYITAEADDELDNFHSQEEFDQATKWVYFGDRDIS